MSLPHFRHFEVVENTHTEGNKRDHVSGILYMAISPRHCGMKGSPTWKTFLK